MRFKEGKKYRIVYHIAKLSPAFADNNTTRKLCKCTCDVWTATYKTGNAGLKKGEVKFKCSECGKFFIAKEEDVEALLGEI